MFNDNTNEFYLSRGLKVIARQNRRHYCNNEDFEVIQYDDDEIILKNKLNNWLRQVDEIIAFCSAVAKDGGQGALYLLLRRRVSLGK